MFLCISRVPTASRIGITQYISKYLNFELDPWTNNYDQKLSENDKNILFNLTNINEFND